MIVSLTSYSILGSFSFDEVASELQDAKSWLHLSVHIDSTLGETVSGDTKGESLLESLQLKTPACSKMLEPLVRSGLVTVADTAGDGKDVLIHSRGCVYIMSKLNISYGSMLSFHFPPDVAVLPIPNEVSPQSEDATVRERLSQLAGAEWSMQFHLSSKCTYCMYTYIKLYLENHM